MPQKNHSHNFNDLTGNRYGKLVVIKYLGSKNGQSKWLCHCDCGNNVERLGVSLKNGASSCGCEKKTELLGKRFGKLTVIGYDDSSTTVYSKWICKCDCGNIKSIRRQSLVENKTVSCGCKNKIDLVGKKFGRLTVKERIGPNKWKCKCECGNEIIALGSNLQRMNTSSCGCFAIELTSKRSKTHGSSYTRLYSIWTGMKQRCFNKKIKSYKYYGAKGIRVCDEWLDFSIFKQWSLSNGYTDELSIDRIDSNGDYCPENCRWVTLSEQKRNMSTNSFITYNNETHTVAEWARIVGMNDSSLSWRKRNGWTNKECIEGKTKLKALS